MAKILYATLKTTAGRIVKITNVTDTYLVLVSDESVICNKATAFAVTLFPAVTATIGQKITISNINTGVVTITADATGTADLIDGVATQAIYQWETIQLECNAADKWKII